MGSPFKYELADLDPLTIAEEQTITKLLRVFVSSKFIWGDTAWTSNTRLDWFVPGLTDFDLPDIGLTEVGLAAPEKVSSKLLISLFKLSADLLIGDFLVASFLEALKLLVVETVCFLVHRDLKAIFDM